MERLMKVLVIGSGGMLGHITTLYLRELGYHVTDISKVNKIDERTLLINVLDATALSVGFLSGFDAVINCAALLVNPSEKHKPEAVLLNAWFPHKLESDLRNTNTKIIHVSTDGIFSGSHAPYTENAFPDTQIFYGKSKILGELNNHKDLTVRASFLGPDINKNGTGLFHWFVRQTGNISGFDSVFFNAVTNLEFAKFADFALRGNFAGIYHLGASETISKARFIRKVKQQFGLNHITIMNDNSIKSDHTLLNTRNDIGYRQKSYDEMLSDLEIWLNNNKNLYPHYTFCKGGTFDE